VDVADAVLFLSSPLSSSTTGHLIPVDSGLL
jgi:enoyl-[acyl-carrier-protein] reductase (NADH)